MGLAGFVAINIAAANAQEDLAPVSTPTATAMPGAAGAASSISGDAQDAVADTASSPKADPKPTRDNSSAVAATLGAGTFTVGVHLAPGRYTITTPEGFGNFFVYDDGLPIVNELLGQADLAVPSITTNLADGDSIEIRGLAEVVFTPAEPGLYTTITAGSWNVGLDVPAGRYIVTPTDPASFGNFFVYDGSWPVVNEILGGDYGVPSVTVDLADGQEIRVGGLPSVTLTAA
jgi:hypothetical protein